MRDWSICFAHTVSKPSEHSEPSSEMLRFVAAARWSLVARVRCAPRCVLLSALSSSRPSAPRADEANGTSDESEVGRLTVTGETPRGEARRTSPTRLVCGMPSVCAPVEQ